jgi:hypothetical protein
MVTPNLRGQIVILKYSLMGPNAPNPRVGLEYSIFPSIDFTDDCSQHVQRQNEQMVILKS